MTHTHRHLALQVHTYVQVFFRKNYTIYFPQNGSAVRDEKKTTKFAAETKKKEQFSSYRFGTETKKTLHTCSHPHIFRRRQKWSQNDDHPW